MKQIDLSIVNDDFLESYYDSINIENIKDKLNDRKYKKITDNLELLIKADLSEIKSKLNLCDSYSFEEKKEIKNAFNYSNHRQNEKFMEYFKKLDIKSCPFCNNNYVYFYKKDSDKYNTIATLEHYYPKSKYPHLSLSFYNLIPSCNTCNSKFKGNDSHEGNILHPYFEDFNEKVKFSIDVNALPVDKDIELEVNLHTDDTRSVKTIDRFQLKEVYSEHNDIAKEIWNKAQVYNESRIEELYESFFKNLNYTKEDVKNMAFCNYLNKDDINKRNHSKLTQDILKQFDLIKEKI
ncbi:hypothetical protein [Arcobacter sp. YIC-310]|uniref:hypothetical protein n=1 Tax=Arcobacter sp. YIC-310 TaxID=3376632 RepID=UPI003C1E74EC